MKLNLQLFASTYTKNEQTTNQSSQGGGTSHTVTNNAAGTVDAQTQQKYDQYKQGYKPSDKVNQAYQQLQDTLNNKPGEFSSNYTAELDKLYQQVMGREKFSYDMNEDLLYQQYKDMYIRNGQKAMQDTLGQASALTGGYNNSYAQNAAQQAYQGYLGELNDMVPQLYQQAFDRYQQEGDELFNQFSLAKDMYEKDYGAYRDSVTDWQADRNFSQGAYESERDFDYNDFANMLNFWQNEYWNQRHAVSVSDTDSSSWENTTSTTTGASSSTSSGSGSSEGSSGKPYVTTYSEAYAYLKSIGRQADGAGLLTAREFSRYEKYKEQYGSYQNYLNEICNL